MVFTCARLPSPFSNTKPACALLNYVERKLTLLADELRANNIVQEVAYYPVFGAFSLNDGLRNDRFSELHNSRH